MTENLPETLIKQEFQVANRLNGIGEYYFSQKLRQIDQLNKEGKNIINLGIGSPDLPPHPSVIQVLQEESSKPNVHAYQGYKGSPIFRNSIATWYKEWYGVNLNPDTEILPLIGSKEGIMHICMTYLDQGDLVLVPDPGYPTYTSAAKLAGAVVVQYSLNEENDWFPDFIALENQVRKAGNKKVLMFANYPHMPSGKAASKELFQKLVSFANNNQVLLVHDNPYSFILNNEPMSILSVAGITDWVIELNSLSKSHNMAGWRIGMLCGSEKRITEILRFKSNMDSGMFLPAQLAAVKALSLGADWFGELNNVYKERREKVYQLLDLLPCSYDKNQVGMFLWARINAEYQDAYALSDAILEKANVFITPGGIFGAAGNNYIRISLCSPGEKLEESINRIKSTNL
ncbi:MAG: aminotransferase class I/II-fold pyridoxal phosphate-dependent enzyme [Chitinophagaceae bacterium]|jgi:aspartate/methionine/tyrosine aminotransferase|nr:aminotransferase class I/II-fold pyridoxal phosphate-dependent enzyme [Chitinophagaceae bacterium]